MSTPQHHLQALNDLFPTISDKIALAAAGAVGSAPWWVKWLQETHDIPVLLGPWLAGVFVMSKTIQVWIEIWRKARERRDGE
jgi:hypothetical protein